MKAEKILLLAALLLLAIGMLFGITGAWQYMVPGFLKSILSFERIRPLHVSAVIFWILLAAVATVLTYVQDHTKKPLFSRWLLKIQVALFLGTILAILISYSLGVFGGREYWEFPPALALPIVIGWILLLINFLKTIGTLRKQPVYIWMWLTGIIFFLFTFLESYLWVIPYFNHNILKDMTIQWKSYGSMVGAWNMLIYGSSIYLMEKISKQKNYSHSPIAFILYFTGLFNLMFNWGHHIYTLPAFHFVQYISYAVSMTELFIFGRIIWLWRSTVTDAQKHFNHQAYRLMIAADVWIFLVLLQALLMSVPAINVYTHGTHITVAHTMGATIGINSFLLLAFAVDIITGQQKENAIKNYYSIFGFWISNISLFIFWISLIAAGVVKANWQMHPTNTSFGEMMKQLKPFFMVFTFSGVLLTIGLLVLVLPLVRILYTNGLKKETK